jgi:hypothetical protein
MYLSFSSAFEIFLRIDIFPRITMPILACTSATSLTPMLRRLGKSSVTKSTKTTIPFQRRVSAISDYSSMLIFINRNVVLTLFLMAGERHGHFDAGIARGIHRENLTGLLGTKVHERQVCRQECDGHGMGRHRGKGQRIRLPSKRFVQRHFKSKMQPTLR